MVGSVLGVAVWAIPATVQAQFAGVTPPPARRAAAPAPVAAVDTTHAVARHPTTQLTDLTAWVDSATNARAARMNEAAPAAVCDTAPKRVPPRTTRHGGGGPNS